jgi:hypothetical protein
MSLHSFFFFLNIIDANRFATIIILVTFNQVSLSFSLSLFSQKTRDESLAFSSFDTVCVCTFEIYSIYHTYKVVTLYCNLSSLHWLFKTISRLYTRGLLLCKTMFPFNQFVAAQYRYSKFGRYFVFFLSICASMNCDWHFFFHRTWRS